jgi:hypothetical protein
MPGAAHQVDRAHVVAVPVLDCVARPEIDSQRRAEERRLDVVHRESIAREDDIHVTQANQLAQVVSAAGVHDDRTGDEGDPAVPFAGGAQHLRHPGNGCLHPPLGRDIVAHDS